MNLKYKTREQWLNAAAQKLKPRFAAAGVDTTQPFRVSIGFPSSGRKGKAIGECWSNNSTADSVCEIYITPTLDNPNRIIDILAHELVHAYVGHEAKHGPAFKRVALAIGLTGKMTATVASDELNAWIDSILPSLGDLPHSALAAGTNGKKKQSTRMRKAHCTDCGYTVRVTAKWIDTAIPTCPNESCDSCGEHMHVDSPEDSEGE